MSHETLMLIVALLFAVLFTAGVIAVIAIVERMKS
jgi:hypothetical protein